MEKKEIIKCIAEAVEAGRQSGKSETSGLVQDIKVHLKITNEHLGRIDKHLETLNSKVATNVANIGELQVATKLNQPKIDQLISDYDETNKQTKQWYRRWREWLAWITVAILIFLLVKGGFISSELVEVVK